MFRSSAPFLVVKDFMTNRSFVIYACRQIGIKLNLMENSWWRGKQICARMAQINRIECIEKCIYKRKSKCVILYWDRRKRKTKPGELVITKIRYTFFLYFSFLCNIFFCLYFFPLPCLCKQLCMDHKRIKHQQHHTRAPNWTKRQTPATQYTLTNVCYTNILSCKCKMRHSSTQRSE